MVQELTNSGFGDCFLPGDKYPYWLFYKGEGPSVVFQVPQLTDLSLKGMTLCIVYSCSLNKMASEYPIGVLIINYTKNTIQIYKRETVTSFGDEEWKDLMSRLGQGETVEVVVVFGYGFVVKKTAMYLICAESIEENMEPSPVPVKNVIASSGYENTSRNTVVKSKGFQSDDDEEVPFRRSRKTMKMCMLEP